VNEGREVEPGLAGRTVFIDLNADDTLDAGDPTAVTDANGNYTFANMAPGERQFLPIPNRATRSSSPLEGVPSWVQAH
jgi:hypothetical protein